MSTVEMTIADRGIGPDHPVYAELLAVMTKRIAAGEAVPWRRPE